MNSRTKKILCMNISKSKLSLMKDDAKFYSQLSDGDLKTMFKFSYKRITKIFFPEYFLKN